jgi:hypothetical protein
MRGIWLSASKKRPMQHTSPLSDICIIMKFLLYAAVGKGEGGLLVLTCRHAGR